MIAPDDITTASAAVSDVGLVRGNNEDSAFATAPMFVVADGMGGYDAGEVASAAVVEAFRLRRRSDALPTVADVREALEAATLEVGRISARTAKGAGSTVAGAILVEQEGVPHWLVFNVGDSRVYRHVGSELTQVTIDHSLGQELLDEGQITREEFETFPRRNVITRAIGAENSTADSWLMPVTNGERILLCSDGLTGEVSDEGIRATLTMSGGPESAARALVQRARQAGGHDNITVVVVDVLAGGQAPGADETTGLRMSSGMIADPDLEATTVPVSRR